MANSSKPIEKISVVNLDSDDIAENKFAYLEKYKDEGDGFLASLITYYTALVEIGVFSWLGSILYTIGSISDLFLDFWYVIDHSVLAAGSALWMLYALAKKKYPILLQHTVMLSMSIYILIKQLNIGKFAYLTTALLCTSCSVYRHESVMSENLVCDTAALLTNTTDDVGMPVAFRRPVCNLEPVYLTIDEKIGIVGKIEQILVYLNGNGSTGGPLGNMRHRHIYTTAKAELNDIRESLLLKKSNCRS